MQDSDVKKALLMCAVGFDTEETVEEFAMQDGELALVKKKVTKKGVPPDIKAVKILLEKDDLSAMSDDELIKEREELIKLLKENYIDEN